MPGCRPRLETCRLGIGGDVAERDADVVEHCRKARAGGRRVRYPPLDTGAAGTLLAVTPSGRPRWGSRLPTFWTNTSSPGWEARRLPSNTANTSRTSERTSSFVCELSLRVGWVLGRRLAAKVEAARQVYNACLGEALRRLGLMRQSVWFTKAKTTPRAQKEERQAHFRAARDRQGFSDAALQRYGIRLRTVNGPAERGTLLRCGGEAASRPTLRGAKAEKTWLGEHLGAHEVQTLASRAYRATRTSSCWASAGAHASRARGACIRWRARGLGAGSAGRTRTSSFGATWRASR